MPDPQDQQSTSVPAQTPPPDLSGLRTKPIQTRNLDGLRTKPVTDEKTWQTIKRNLTPQLDTSRRALGPGHEFDSGSSPQEQGEELYKENSGTPVEQAYGHAKRFLNTWEGKLSDRVLAPFRTGLDNIADELEQAGESGHTREGGQLTGPTRALLSGTGALLKQVPVSRNVKETAQALAVPEFPEARGLSQEIKTGEKTAVNLEGFRTRPVSEGKLPPQSRLPNTGTHAAIKTDDGGIYFDAKPEKQRTHIMLAQDLGIPPERVVSGGWLQDGHYEASERSDAGRWGERARAQKTVEAKRMSRSQSEQTPESPTPKKSKSLVDRLSEQVGPQGGHAGGGVASVEELARPGRFVKISRSGVPTDQGKVPDFNLKAGEAGYQVKPDGTWELKAGQETSTTKVGVQNYAKEVFRNKKQQATARVAGPL